MLNMNNLKLIQEEAKRKRERFFTNTPKAQAFATPNGTPDAANKRQIVLKVIKLMAETQVINSGDKPTDTESNKSYEDRKYFQALKPSKMTDTDIDRLYNGLRNSFPNK